MKRRKVIVETNVGGITWDTKHRFMAFWENLIEETKQRVYEARIARAIEENRKGCSREYSAENPN